MAKKKSLSHSEVSALGGKAAFSKMTPEERAEFSRKGVEARKEKKKGKKTFEAGYGGQSVHN